MNVWEVQREEVNDKKEVVSVQQIILANTALEALAVALGTAGTFRYEEDMPDVTLVRKVTHITSTYRDLYKVVPVEPVIICPEQSK